MVELKDRHCEPCEAGTKPYSESETRQFLRQLSSGWEVIEEKKIRKRFPFENFKRGMAFAQEVALLAEEEAHHPDLCIQYTGVEVELSTHSIGGLSENDFIMAAKIDQI